MFQSDLRTHQMVISPEFLEARKHSGSDKTCLQFTDWPVKPMCFRLGFWVNDNAFKRKVQEGVLPARSTMIHKKKEKSRETCVLFSFLLRHVARLEQRERKGQT